MLLVRVDETCSNMRKVHSNCNTTTVNSRARKANACLCFLIEIAENIN